MDVISHTELLSLWKRGMRNGTIRRLSPIKRGLFSAAIDYSQIFGVIRNRDLITLIKDVVERIGKSLSQRIWDRGLKRAQCQTNNARVNQIFPMVRRWINDDAYILWLGTEALNKNRWVILPISKL